MEFGLTEEQISLQDNLNRLLADVSSLEKVRDFSDKRNADKRAGYSSQVWQAMSEMGLASVMVPEKYGGLGLSLLDAALIQESLGRYTAAAPFMSSAVLAVIALLEAGSDNQQAEWLEKIADGSTTFGIAVSEASGARDDARVTFEDGKLSGKALFVTDIDSADQFIVADHHKSLYLVSGGAMGLVRQQLPNIDRTRQIGELAFSQVEATALPVAPENAVKKIFDAGRVLLAADSLGAAQVMIERSVGYVKERKQFGRLIGSFQAIKHLCAEMTAELEPCRSLLWYAAYAYDEVPEEASLMAAHAKSHIADVGQFIARSAVEVHGGIGFTHELGLHYWFKRIGLNRQLLGGPTWLRDEIAQLQGWGNQNSVL